MRKSVLVVGRERCSQSTPFHHINGAAEAADTQGRIRILDTMNNRII